MALTKEQALALASARLRLQQTQDHPTDQQNDPNSGAYHMFRPENLVGSAVEPLGVLASGAVATPLAGLAGIGAAISKKFGLSDTDAADVVRSVQEALTYKPQTEGGQVATESVTSPFQLLGRGANYAGEKAADITGSPAVGAGVNALIQTAPAVLGGKAAGGLEASAAPKFVAPVVGLAAKAGRGVRNLIDPHLPGGTQRAATRTLNAAAGERAPAVIKALETPAANPLNIPQSAGQVAADAGSAEFSALQKMVEKHKPSEYIDLKTAAEDARKEAIQRIGGTPEQLSTAISTRAKNAKKAYDEAGAEVVQPDATIFPILRRPSMIKAFGRARELAKEDGVPFRMGSDKAGTGYKVSSLHYVKLALDDMISNPERFGIGAAEARSIGGTRASFVEWLGNKSKKYDAAREAYAAESKPINQMQVGQALEGKLANSLDSGERASSFASSVKEAPSLIKKSTGQARYKELSAVLTPEQMQIVNSLMNNLRRDAKFEQQAQKGAYSAQERVGSVTPEIKPTGFFSPFISFSRGLVNRMSGHASDRVMHFLADIMRNPDETARIMREATPEEAAVVNEVLKTNKKQVFVGSAVAGAQQQANQ